MPCSFITDKHLTILANLQVKNLLWNLLIFSFPEIKHLEVSHAYRVSLKAFLHFQASNGLPTSLMLQLQPGFKTPAQGVQRSLWSKYFPEHSCSFSFEVASHLHFLTLPFQFHTYCINMAPFILSPQILTWRFPFPAPMPFQNTKDLRPATVCVSPLLLIPPWLTVYELCT